jgi:ERCC4-type nuclease
LYLIEGSINFKKESKEITSLYSSLFSLNYYKGFSVIRTFSINETAHFILSIAKKLSKESDRTPFYSVNIIGGTSGTVDEIDNVDVDIDVDEVKYSKVIKRVKKDNITKENIGEIILSQIPGVSLATAQAVLKNYEGKISELIKSLEKDPNALNNIKQVNSKGKEVKIRKTSITNIYKFML